jgi:hypothetical protein
MPSKLAQMAALPGVSSLMGELGQLRQEIEGETDEQRRKRLEGERQARLLGSAMPGASTLGLGAGPGGGLASMSQGGYGR